LLVWLGQACVELPGGDAPESESERDSGLGPLDGGGLRKPPTAAPYMGPQCDNAQLASSVIVAGDAGTAAVDEGGDPMRPAGTAGSASPNAAGGSGVAAPPTAALRPGQVVISELMSNPAALSDTDGEWIELYNPSASESVVLDGCALDDGSASKALMAGARIMPLGYATLARSAQVGFVPTQLLSFSLGNSDDSLALVCGGIEIDRVRYGAGFPLAAGASMSLSASALDATANDDASAWCLGTEPDALGERGTPGASNPPCGLEDGGAL
jgi:hypothetical protein